MLTARFSIDPESQEMIRLSDIASNYSTDIETIARCNNCTIIPTFANEIPSVKTAGYIILPLPGNGGLANVDNWDEKEEELYTLRLTADKKSSIGSEYDLTGPGSAVILTIGGISLAMPCYPTTLTDSLQVNHNSNSVAYRTEPYINYVSSGPRTVTAAFNLHREMKGDSRMSDIDTIINTIQAACYPTGSASNSVEAKLKVGKSLSIRGVITGGVQVSFSGPIIEGKYNVYDISFTITEVKDSIIMFGTKQVYGPVF